ncbi:hypothetical protein E4T56_gene20156 [Termitomyces sp. T112]|nr:hypothetical protein E4T56_gene20156 [Termitomyces sp. T112]
MTNGDVNLELSIIKLKFCRVSLSRGCKTSYFFGSKVSGHICAFFNCYCINVLCSGWYALHRVRHSAFESLGAPFCLSSASDHSTSPYRAVPCLAFVR